ncbi:MAG: radical SAM protein [bacterium]|nr:MAG: radical SAM protein [bacterium]
MIVLAKTGREDVATVYLAETADGGWIEFVESVQPPIPRRRKWVLILSTLHGCPGGCRFCDAGSFYRGRLTRDEILAQVDYMVGRRFGDRKVPVEKFKVQFARMGEPAFNGAVIEVLEELPRRLDAPGLMPAVSTVAPRGTEDFFERLLEIKREHYNGRFQLQFSIHTTDVDLGNWLMPLERWDSERIAQYGERWFEEGDRKVTLNFALAEGMPVSPEVLRRHFSPDIFILKMTPINPTFRARENGIASHIVPGRERYDVIEALRAQGYEVILSIGELEENHIGSNCGQYVTSHIARGECLEGGYTYEAREVIAEVR